MRPPGTRRRRRSSPPTSDRRWRPDSSRPRAGAASWPPARRSGPGADPGAVVFDALDAASARGVDVVIADTAGRLHTKRDLMDELAKIRRVIERRLPGSRPDVLLVLDATTGQNGLHQARVFHES